MKTLVLKCAESVNNDNLRGMNELRVKLFKGTDASARGYFGAVRDSGEAELEYKIVKGSANLYSISSSQVAKQALKVTGTGNAPYVTVSSDAAEVSITNLALIADYLGKDSSNQLYYGISGAPIALIDLGELTQLGSLSSVYALNTCQWYGQLSCLGDVENIHIIGSSYDGYNLKGDVKSLTSATSIYIDDTSENAHYCTFNYDDLATLNNCSSFYLRKFTSTGGDIYNLLKAKSQLSLESVLVVGEPFTCSYTSGDTIPTIDISKLIISTYYAYPTVANTAALLTLLKDGKNANKITLPSSIRIMVAPADRSNATLTGLASDLAALGCTVAFS